MGINLNDIAKEQGSNTKKDITTGSKLKELLNKDISFGRGGLSDKKKQAIFNDLHLLLEAGLDIKRVLELIVEEQKKKKDKEILEEIYKKVITGNSLSEAMEMSTYFTTYECYSVKIGEESGKLDEVLMHLRNHFEKKIDQKRQITSALSYPVLVMVVAFGAVAFMIGFVVPTFADTFKKLDIELPAVTKFIISLSDSFASIALGGLAVFAVMGAFYYLNKDKTWFQKGKAKVLLSLPVFGGILHLSYLTQFSQSMSLLLRAKTPLLDALGLIKKMINSYDLEQALDASKEEIMKGESLATTFSKYKIFPSRMIYLIGVGEEVNKLDGIFSQLAELYSKELEHRSKLLSTVIEPILIVFLGLIVGFILVAMYLPMFSITDMLGK